MLKYRGKHLWNISSHFPSFLDHDDIFLRFFVNVVWTKKSEQRYFLFFFFKSRLLINLTDRVKTTVLLFFSKLVSYPSSQVEHDGRISHDRIIFKLKGKRKKGKERCREIAAIFRPKNETNVSRTKFCVYVYNITNGWNRRPVSPPVDIASLFPVWVTVTPVYNSRRATCA